MNTEEFPPNLFVIAALCVVAGWLWAILTRRQGWSRWQTMLTVAVPVAFVHLFATTGGASDSTDAAAVVLYNCHASWNDLSSTATMCRLLRMGLLFADYWRGGWVVLWGAACGIGILLGSRARSGLPPRRYYKSKDLSASLWLLTSLFTSLAISGLAAHERTISRYVGEHMRDGLHGCGTTWNLVNFDGNSILRYWFAFLWEACENAPISIWVAAGLLVAIGMATLGCLLLLLLLLLLLRTQNLRSKLVLVAQSMAGAAALFCLGSIFARYDMIIEELGTQLHSLQFLKLEWFSLLVCVILLGAFSALCCKSFERRLLWLLLLSGALSTLRYMAEVGTKLPLYWPLTSLPALQHLSQDRWYLAAAGLNLLLVYARSWTVRANWMRARIAAPCVVLATLAFAVAQTLAYDSWKVTPYKWQEMNPLGR